MASSVVPKEASKEVVSSPPSDHMIHHTPMSERQQLALIKKMEKANAEASSISGGSSSSDSILTSPPRAPLQVVTDAGNNATSSSPPSAASASTNSSSNEMMTPNSSSSSRASSKYNSPTVDRLLKKISKKNTKGETPLHTAAIRGSSRLVKQLLQMGADPNAQDNAEWSALHEACNRGNLGVVKVLKEFGADLNLKGFAKDSPLHDAARNGHLKVVKFLVRSGADLAAKNASNRTPREEAEVTRLRIPDNTDLDKTVTYLIEQEDRKNEASEAHAMMSNSDSEDGDENNDIAKFLGLTKSPVVREALQTLGLSSPSPRKRRRKKSMNTTPSSKNQHSKASNDGGIKAEVAKIRLTYDCEDKEEKNIKDKKTDEEPVKAVTIEEPSTTGIDDTLKVPPLKIVLSSMQRGSVSEDKTAESEPEPAQNNDYVFKKRRLRTAAVSSPAKNQGDQANEAKKQAVPEKNRPLSDIEKFIKMRKQIEAKRKNIFPVQPKPPEGFKDYLMNRKTYLLQSTAAERLRSMPLIQPPASLKGALRELFKKQEEERFKLRTKHMVEKEKLVLSVEQEILRVHGRAARALANQSLPFSACTILRDQDIYNPLEAAAPHQRGEESQNSADSRKDVRSRYNGRLFLSWLQDVDDKWEKIKEQMVLRHHNEAESLNAVQKMDWEWKVAELNEGNPHHANAVINDDLYIPMVRVSDDFCLTVQ